MSCKNIHIHFSLSPPCDLSECLTGQTKQEAKRQDNSHATNQGVSLSGHKAEWRVDLEGQMEVIPAQASRFPTCLAFPHTPCSPIQSLIPKPSLQLPRKVAGLPILNNYPKGIPIDHLKDAPSRDLISHAISMTGSVAGRFKRDLGNTGSLLQHLSIPAMGSFVPSTWKHNSVSQSLFLKAFFRKLIT